jgi:hypothetical protein
MQTLNVILPWLKFLAGIGAGFVASLLFDWLRSRFAARKGTGGMLDAALFSPRLARYTAWGLSALIALPAAALAALIEGQDALAAIDATAAVLLSAVASQVKHAQSLPLATDTTVVRIPDPTVPVEPIEVRV